MEKVQVNIYCDIDPGGRTSGLYRTTPKHTLLTFPPDFQSISNDKYAFESHCSCVKNTNKKPNKSLKNNYFH